MKSVVLKIVACIGLTIVSVLIVLQSEESMLMGALLMFWGFVRFFPHGVNMDE